ncbi:Nucleoside-diphosphate-sugar epimerase [Siphonobacter aquaeclarae]|uniref:Nucleoside-diphosphate-sugar epimerase n=2 Tax=Siphonobacter aquaeclarae TaxID=563176 RepID=A0A1G9MAH7_9BACT|nr:Nucleoside-diphosphate-sugar epimerase [Siphonobacter aquaeclarae]
MSEPMKQIGIVGCGWLGLPLGKHLAAAGYDVTGTVTSPEKTENLAQAGIHPLVLRFDPEPSAGLDSLLNSDVLIISIPPRAGQHGDDFHPAQIDALLRHLAGFSGKLIYISSTSVYPDSPEVITESNDVIPGHPLVRAETALQNSGHPATILRCGGLMGDDRVAGKYFIGKTVSNGATPVNFIHREDVIGLIRQVIEQGVWGEVFNVVAPQHPSRKEVYLQNAKDKGWEAPVFEEPARPLPFKLISGERIAERLTYSFLYPDPLYFP